MKSKFLLIFDFFGVFCGDIGTIWSLKYSFSDAKNKIKNDLYVQADLGKITYEKLLEELGLLANIPTNQVKEEWDELIQINYDVVSIAQTYKNNYYTALLTNANVPLIRGIIDRYNLSDCFDELFISSEIGIVKPDINAYKYVLNKFEIPACQVILIDDNITNINVADSLGIFTIHYTSATDLTNKLKTVTEDCSK